LVKATAQLGIKPSHLVQSTYTQSERTAGWLLVVPSWRAAKHLKEASCSLLTGTHVCNSLDGTEFAIQLSVCITKTLLLPLRLNKLLSHTRKQNGYGCKLLQHEKHSNNA
jgi:hypothetical protein